METKPGLAGLGALRPNGARRGAPVKVSAETLVQVAGLAHSEGFPLVIEPRMPNLDPAAWAANARLWIEERLLATGALLFRGFHLPDVQAFRGFIAALSQDLLDYVERAAPRHQVAPSVYTSTEFAAAEVIPLHHEMSYSHNWPTTLWFYCQTPAEAGGMTPIASEREVTRRLAPDVKERFIAKRLMYVRNYGEGVDMSWQEAFQTDDRAVVEAYCRKAGMAFEWRPGDRLRTRGVRNAVATHPRTGETLWFNHAPLFHETNLPPAVHQALRAQFEPDEMPRNVFYGDGTPIEPAALDHIRRTYDEAAVRFPWHAGDVLMVDNFLAVHGRDPFQGHRSLLVAMAGLYTDPDLATAR